MSASRKKNTSGSRQLDPFVDAHFKIASERHPTTRRYHMQCKHCPPGSPLIEHRDKRCIQHLSKYELCPDAPPAVRKEALIRLVSGSNAPVIVTDAQLTGGSENNDLSSEAGSSVQLAINVDSNEGNTQKTKKQKKSAQLNLNAFVDRVMTDAEKEDADLLFLRFLIHGAVAWRASENPYLVQWAHKLRPTYLVPTRYVLTNSYLPQEEARVTLAEEGRLQKMKLLTLMIDGWEDVLRRSVYGSLLAELGIRPVVLGLTDLTGQRATADNIVAVIELSMKKKGASLWNGSWGGS
ncbi:hypothetical protein C8Q80DRAFT_1353696 [Daedaleopsis nitida]|nr:hypothetical protein C8Q80DRAFT_1353696 [Daedaleopsis nitida]